MTFVLTFDVVPIVNNNSFYVKESERVASENGALGAGNESIVQYLWVYLKSLKCFHEKLANIL